MICILLCSSALHVTDICLDTPTEMIWQHVTLQSWKQSELGEFRALTAAPEHTTQHTDQPGLDSYKKLKEQSSRDYGRYDFWTWKQILLWLLLWPVCMLLLRIVSMLSFSDWFSHHAATGAHVLERLKYRWFRQQLGGRTWDIKLPRGADLDSDERGSITSVLIIVSPQGPLAAGAFDRIVLSKLWLHPSPWIDQSTKHWEQISKPSKMDSDVCLIFPFNTHSSVVHNETFGLGFLHCEMKWRTHSLGTFEGALLLPLWRMQPLVWYPAVVYLTLTWLTLP